MTAYPSSDVIVGPVAGSWEQRVILGGYDQLSFHTPKAMQLQQALQTVMVHGSDLVDPTGQTDKADPYIVALAYLHGGKVVTDERRRRDSNNKKKKKKKKKIPDVCDDLSVPCLS